jgi:inosine/xanthosine triphosphatase
VNKFVTSIVLASHNPVKIRATLGGFERMFPDSEFTIENVSVASGVSEQPRSDEETRQGAFNRVQNAMGAVPQADYWVGIEGGIDHDEELGAPCMAFAWVVIRSKELTGQSRTGAFVLPDAVVRLLNQGKELGEADDEVFGRVNSKQETGAVGLLTDDVITRESLYEHGVILALAPFKQSVYFGGAGGDTE